MGDKRRVRALTLVMGLFFICGLSTALNSVLIPYFHKTLSLPYAAVACLETSFYMGYFLWSPLAGVFFSQARYLRGITWGLSSGLLGAALLALSGFYLHFSLVLFAIFILGGGIATIQVTANPYAMLLGTKDTASSRLCISQAFTAIGTLLAPLLGGYILAPFWSSIPLFFPYAVISLLWLGHLFFVFSAQLSEEGEDDKLEQEGETLSPWKDPALLLGLCAMVLSLGGDAATVSFLVPYLSDTHTLGISLDSAVKLSMLFWLGLLVGRLLGSYLMRMLKPEFLVFAHLVGITSLSFFVSLAGGKAAAVAVLSLGFCLSILFPTLFSLILERCRCSKSVASGVLCMTNIGGALAPLAQGVLADRLGVPISFLLPAVCYLLCLAFFIAMLRVADQEPTARECRVEA